VKILSVVELPQDRVEDFIVEFPQLEYSYRPADQLREADMEEAEIIFGNVPADSLDRAKNLKWIQLISAGIDDYLALTNKTFQVTTAKGFHSRPIAEHLIFSMLYFVKNYRTFFNKKNEKVWFRKPDSLGTLAGQNVAIIGMGGIGNQFIRCIQPFYVNLEVITLHPDRKHGEDLQIYGPGDLNNVLRRADHIVLALPLTSRSRHILNKDLLLKTKEGVIIYNVSRGPLIDESALIELLESGHIGGAYLDVFEEEPLSPHSKLWDMDNVIITPHIAGHYKGLREDVFNFFKENLRRLIQKQELLNLANFQKGY